MFRRLLAKVGAAWGLGLLAAACLPAEEKPAADAKPAPPRERYVRIARDDDKRPLALETAVVSYQGKSGGKPVQVDLVGAVHVADKAYYDELNKLFEEYDVVLYELVAPKDARPKPGERGSSPVSSLQVGMKSMLALEFQLDHIDYKRKNFVHADMSPDEFARSMQDRGESFTQLFFRMMGQSIAQQNAGGNGGEFNLLAALFSKDRANRLKLAMAEQLQDMETAMVLFDGKDGSTIITERNRKALEVLAEQLRAGKRKVAIFYGAGHLADMDQRLRTEFGLARDKERWLQAWSLRPAAAVKSAPAGDKAE